MSVIIFSCVSLLTGYPFQGWSDWAKVKNNSYVSALGHWSNGEMESEVILSEELVPIGISRNEWKSLMADNDFKISESGACEPFIPNYTDGRMSFTKKYDVCAMKNVGSYTLSTCSYWYIMMGKFEDENLVQSAGTRMIFMC